FTYVRNGEASQRRNSQRFFPDFLNLLLNAVERTRTSTELPPLAPQASASAIPPRPRMRVEGLEPPCRETLEPDSSASANSATPAYPDAGGQKPDARYLGIASRHSFNPASGF